MKQYKAIFFDWDGTAVLSRKAPVDDIVRSMKGKLEAGIQMVIVSGTTYENIANGELHRHFTPQELKNLYLGLGRGAYNYRFNEDGSPYIWKNLIPSKENLLTIHDVCYAIHRHLLEQYDFPTDVVFSRPNYCKIDLMVENNRGDQLFFQENELDMLKNNLTGHGFHGGVLELIRLAESIGAEKGLNMCATSDAKYLEVGLSSKSDNVNTIMEHFEEQYQLRPEECAFWGDEYIGLDDGIFGSDSYMLTDRTRKGDFFDVSAAQGIRPENVRVLGGGVERFLAFLNGATEQP